MESLINADTFGTSIIREECPKYSFQRVHNEGFHCMSFHVYFSAVSVCTKEGARLCRARDANEGRRSWLGAHCIVVV